MKIVAQLEDAERRLAQLISELRRLADEAERRSGGRSKRLVTALVFVEGAKGSLGMTIAITDPPRLLLEEVELQGVIAVAPATWPRF
jgi:hypothetical protein